MKKVLCALALLVVLPTAVFAQNVGYDGGFFVKNDEDTFKLRINGRIQPLFEFTKQTIDPTSSLGFSLRRAELGFTGSIEDHLTVRFTLKHATNSANFNTLNVALATATYEVMPEFVVTAGMVGLPLSMMAEFSSKWYLMPNAPLTDLQDDGIADFTLARNSFTVPDGLGVNFAGDISKFFYSASVVNGTESNYTFNPDKKISAGVRFGVNILDAVTSSMTDYECSSEPKLTVSAGTMYQASRIDPNTGADIGWMWTSSLGVGLRWAGFAFTTEGYYRRMKVDNPGTAVYARPHLDDMGYYAAVGYYILPKKLELAAQAAQIFRQGPDNNANQFGGGINYYAIGNNLKLQFAYTWTQDYDALWGDGNDNHIHNFQLMVNALF